MNIRIRYLLLLALLGIVSCGVLGQEDGSNSTDIPGKIVFSASDSQTYQIFAMNADGSGLRQLTNLEDGHEAYEPAWSPDGRQIVFSTSLRSSSNGLSLYLMDANGGNMRPLHERENSHIPTPGSNAAWSPDGNKIAWHQCVNCQLGTNYELFTYNVSTDEVTRLTDNRTSETHPTWSPDGQRIAFVSDRDYVEADTMRWRKDLYVMDASGSNLQRLTKIGGIGSTSWHPEDNQIIFATVEGLLLYDFQSDNVLKFNIDLDNVRPINWSEDGRYLLLSKTENYPKDGFFCWIP